jgi:hypothetical protein
MLTFGQQWYELFFQLGIMSKYAFKNFAVYIKT